MRELFSLRTVRKKIVMASKIAGIILIVSYAVATRLPISRNLSLLLWMVFTVLLVLAMDYLLGRFISDPVSEICAAAEKMAQLDFSASCEIDSGDEFGSLAESLNQMAGNLKQALSALENANTRLEADIQKERRLLKERKELADRLSHEMKTPLGVIRAYAEGLQDEADEEKKQRYSEIILSETERMGGLITTLLDLSALESGAARLTPEKFGFVEFVETVAGRLLADIPDACFTLQYELPESEVYVLTDRQRMEQVLNNLIINAKKNVLPGGTIKLSLERRGDELRFSIFNQGMPIPEEEITQIWNKFYRNRNATYSGSGLGLAIVAQILSMQNIEYGAENRPDGVAFYFVIPVSGGISGTDAYG